MRSPAIPAHSLVAERPGARALPRGSSFQALAVSPGAAQALSLLRASVSPFALGGLVLVGAYLDEV